MKKNNNKKYTRKDILEIVKEKSRTLYGSITGLKEEGEQTLDLLVTMCNEEGIDFLYDSLDKFEKYKNDKSFLIEKMVSELLNDNETDRCLKRKVSELSLKDQLTYSKNLALEKNKFSKVANSFNTFKNLEFVEEIGAPIEYKGREGFFIDKLALYGTIEFNANILIQQMINNYDNEEILDVVKKKKDDFMTDFMKGL